MAVAQRPPGMLTPPLRLPDQPDSFDLLTSLPGPYVRLEERPHQRWAWDPFPTPRYRFDSALGARRVRYAATTPAGAARERYRDTGSYIPAHHADHYRIRLEPHPTHALQVLDLRAERVLDALHLDARVSTSYEPQVRQVCWQLSDRAREWWGGEVHALVYTPRTTPETCANVAFYGDAPLSARSRRLRECGAWLDELVVTHGFTVDFTYR